MVILEYLEKEGKKESKALETYITNEYSVSCYKRARKSLVDEKLIQTVKEGHTWYVETLETVETLDTLDDN